MTDAIRACLKQTADAASLDVRLVTAVVLQESSGNPWSWNPEPSYRYLWDVKANRPFRGLAWSETVAKMPPADFPALGGDRDQEWWGQQASWGLMQVMGAVARERGFRGSYLPELCDPGINLAIGCAHLASALKWAKGNVTLALGSYNAGRANAESVQGFQYAQKVLARMSA